jgi:hypothetical protein
MIRVFWDVTAYNLVDRYQLVAPSSFSEVGGDSSSEGLVCVFEITRRHVPEVLISYCHENFRFLHNEMEASPHQVWLFPVHL